MRHSPAGIFFPLFFSLLFSSSIYAQENSPYTRYGIGDLNQAGYPAWRGMGMAGVSLAADSLPLFNPLNPASLGSMRLASFDIGFFGKQSVLETPDTLQWFGNGSISHFSLSVPVYQKKKNFGWGSAFSINPFSRVDYSIAQTNDATSTGGQDISYSGFKGTGSLYKMSVGNGFRFGTLNSICVMAGFNASLLFGNLQYQNTQVYPDTVNAYDTRQTESRSVSGIYFDGGIQVHHALSDHLSLGIGLTGRLNSNLSAKHDEVWDRFNLTAFGAIPRDTIFLLANEHGTITLPSSFTAGISLEHFFKWKAALDFSSESWSNYRSFGKSDSLINIWKIAGGFEYALGAGNVQDYSKAIKLRIGGYYGLHPVKLFSTEMKEAGVSIGAGIPLRRILSELQVSVEAGRRGTTENGLLRESFLRLNIGFTLSDKWFIPQKFD